MKIGTAHKNEFLPHGLIEGSISTGTLNPEHLVNTYFDWMAHNLVKKPDIYREWEDPYNDEITAEEALAEMTDFLESLASCFDLRFGSLEGDGADIGFWKDTE